MKNAFIIDHQRQIIYTEVPKCGSTTVHQLFLDAFGLKTDRGPHHAIWCEDLREERDRVGLEAIRIKDSALNRFISDHTSYRFFTITRNPYARCISAYTNQLRRFAKRRSLARYIQAKINAKRSAASFKSKSSQYDFLNITLREHIPFDTFLRDLEKHGPFFDKHFDLQVNIAKPNLIPYSHILDIENLSAGLRPVFGEAISIDKPRRLNTSAPVLTPEALHEQAREAIHRIYARDFAAFNYSP